jgi:phosphoribosylaminoimidazole carboxylase PurE protein
MPKEPLVGIVMGSDSDWPVMQNCVETLKRFEIPHEVSVRSAHRTPDDCAAYAKQASSRGLKVLIAAAGGAAHLAGVIAAHTVLPVIGVPISATPLQGVDSLYSTVQMPPGIPVATVAIGDFGAVNAAILAAQMLALQDEDMRARLTAYKAEMVEKVGKKNQALLEKIKR